jgi:hypothetical protein
MTNLDLTAYVDESCKPVRDRKTGRATTGQHYVAASAVILSGDEHRLRADLAALAHTIGAPLHYYELSTAKRIDVVKRLADIDGWEGGTFETRHPFWPSTNEHHARAKVIGEALTVLPTKGATHVVLETRGVANTGFGKLNQKDHDVLRKLQRQKQVPAGLRIEHRTKAELILAIADIVAGARTDHLCGVTDQPHALLAHRVDYNHAIGVA